MSTVVENVQVLKEQYNVWKEQSPLLYDLVITHQLSWPSLTVQWFPDVDESTKEQGYKKQQVVLGTQTSGQELGRLMIADVYLPVQDLEKQQIVEGGNLGKIDVIKEFQHIGGDVNKARINPLNNKLVATKTVDSEVLVFNTTFESGSKHIIKLIGHDRSEGFGIDWNKVDDGLIASGSYDKKVCIWRINEEIECQGPLQEYNEHDQYVEDVAWKPDDEHIVGSCGDDKRVILYDTRSKDVASKEEPFHEAEVNSISFNPLNQNLLATCGSDKLVLVFDWRKMKQPQHYMCCHDDAILCIEWNPLNQNWLASGGEDRRVLLYDLSKIGEEQTSLQDAQDGPPELVFSHGGHLAKVVDFGWNPKSDFMMCSVAEENMVQIWQPAKDMFEEEE
eukprot:TRINITY_DN5112_c0_g1_i1.p1 TRINITY_DN5112_c0_g1~~TRINITY_DN5112_c0_g1_i1.p1  ORF type:complete len:391 (+),score=56.73 TRINITY_DN5112_c0_g1_i1:42-1214(+)